MDLDTELDRLAQTPLDEFVRARNELAVRLRAADEGAAALRVHALPKPPLSAWAVNQLYWRDRPAFDALMRAGRSLRQAQQASLTGRAGQVHEAGQARDRALHHALQRTLDLIAEGGQPATPAMRLRIATNLEALAAYGGAVPGSHPGRLADDLDLPGFEVFEGMARAADQPAQSESRTTSRGSAPRERTKGEPPRHEPSGRAKVVSFEAIASARRALAEAEHEAAARRTEAHRAADAVTQERARVKSAEAEAHAAREKLREAQRLVEDAERRLEECRQAVPKRQEEAERAQDAARDAQAAVERARAALDAVRKKK